MQGGGSNILQWLAAGGMLGMAGTLVVHLGFWGETLDAVAPTAVAAAGIGCVLGLAVGALRSLGRR